MLLKAMPYCNIHETYAHCHFPKMYDLIFIDVAYLRLQRHMSFTVHLEVYKAQKNSSCINNIHIFVSIENTMS